MLSSLPVPEWQDLMAQFPVDPYLVWSDITDFRQFQTDGRVLKSLPFLIELNGPYDPDLSYGLNIPTLFNETLNGTDQSCFVTARIDVPAGQHAPSPLPDLIKNAAVLRAQLGFPVTAQKDTAKAPPRTAPPSIQLTYKPDCDVICGLMDDGCAFAHAQFRVTDNPATRVVALWDQTPLPDSTPNPGVGVMSSTLPYGSEITNEMFDGSIAEHWLGDEVDEGACYREIFVDELHGLDTSRTHGTAVLDLFAGAVPPRTHPLDCSDAPRADSPIAFVQFPFAESTVANGRWLATHVLEGLYYLFDVANRLTEIDGTQIRYVRKLCVTLSYGALAGPHNGTGMLPRALAEVAYIRGNLGIVLAAGNSRRAHCHSAPPVLDPGEGRSVSMIIPPVKPFETYLEIWVDDCCDVSITVTPPVGPIRTVRRGKIAVWQAADFSPGASEDRVVAALVFCPSVVQGIGKSMILLATAATEITDKEISAPPGAWKIDVTNQGSTSTPLALWIERDDLLATHPDQFAHFDRQDNDDGDDESCGNPSNDFVKPVNTLASVAGGAFAYPVGGYANVITDSTQPVTLANYSGQGSDKNVPFLYACTDEGFARPGVRVAGTRSASYTRMSGTSVAAPQAARALVKAMHEATGPLNAQDIQRLFKCLPGRDHLHNYHDVAVNTPEGQGPVIVIQIPPAI